MKAKLIIVIFSAIAAAHAFAQTKTDVAGIELGMTPAQARTAAHAISKSYVLTDLLYPDSGKPAGFKGGVKPAGSYIASEAIAVQFSERGQRVISVTRRMAFTGKATKPTTQSIVNSLEEKYGKPSKVEVNVHGVSMIWQYTKDMQRQDLSARYSESQCDVGGAYFVVDGIQLIMPHRFAANCGVRIIATVDAEGQTGNGGKPGLFVTSFSVMSIDIPTAYAELHQEHDAQRKAQAEDLQRRIQSGEALKPKL